MRRFEYDWNAATAARSSTTLTLKERLADIGVIIPDQAEAERAKEALRLGLPHTTPAWRIRIAWFRKLRALMNATSYYEFEWQQFKTDAYRDWGGMPPPAIRAEIEIIQQRLPHVSVSIHALHEDPWVVVSDGQETVLVRGWYRDPKTYNVITIA
jgi:hypothetical protein